jgi:hypothetical protein
MLRTINSHKYQEPISFYSEDIMELDSGRIVAPAVGDTSGKQYSAIFEGSPEHPLLCDFELEED